MRCRYDQRVDGPLDFLGPILELMTWVGFIPGVPLLIWGLILDRRKCLWIRTTSKVSTVGGFRAVEWTDTQGTVRQALLDHDDTPALKVGQSTAVHFDECHPGRWRLTQNREKNTVLILGSILTGLGVACTVFGFVLMIF